MPAAAAISLRINAERIVLVGWLRAILLQLAHPLIAAGVAEHSTFRGSAMGSFSRLSQTVRAMLAISFGGSEERERAIEGIRTIHRRVHGTLTTPCGQFPAGTTYSAEDPDLLLWVHATLVESIVLAYERLVEPLSPLDRDRYCADSADVAIELGARAEAVPRSWAATRQYLDESYASGRIAVGPHARALASALLSPVRNSFGRALLEPLVSVVATGQLPAHVRMQYGLPWNPGLARKFERTMTSLRVLRRLAPANVACWKIARKLKHVRKLDR